MGFLEAGLILLPQLVKFGMDIAPLVDSMIEVARGKEPTAEDWDKLHAAEDKLRDRLNDKSKDV